MARVGKSVGVRKLAKKGRGRPRKEGRRDVGGRLLANVAVIAPTPEQQAKRAMQGLHPTDALDCEVSMLFRAGKLTQGQRDAAQTIERAYRVYAAAICAPKLANGPLGGLQANGGGFAGENDAIAAVKAWRLLEAMLVHEAGMIGQGGAVTRLIELVCRNVRQPNPALPAIRALLDRVTR